jgi:cysteine synthase A
MERHPEPAWIVVGAGTGGTSATIGRYLRYRRLTTRLAVVDPEGSVFYQAWRDGRRDVHSAGSDIEGIGRPRVEPSFIPSVIDHMLVVPNAATIAAMRLIEQLTGRRVGASTGTNIVGALGIAERMRQAGQAGSIVSLICDDGDRYTDTYWNDTWVHTRGWDIEPHLRRLESLLNKSGTPSGPLAEMPNLSLRS